MWYVFSIFPNPFAYVDPAASNSCSVIPKQKLGQFPDHSLTLGGIEILNRGRWVSLDSDRKRKTGGNEKITGLWQNDVAAPFNLLPDFVTFCSVIINHSQSTSSTILVKRKSLKLTSFCGLYQNKQKSGNALWYRLADQNYELSKSSLYWYYCFNNNSCDEMYSR